MPGSSCAPARSGRPARSGWSGRRALAVVALGIAPGSYVVDAGHDELLVHQLPTGKPGSAAHPTEYPDEHPDDGSGDPLLAAVARV